MSRKIYEQAKIDTALAPQSLATTNGTGYYHKLAGYKRALFFFNAAAIAATKTVVAQIMEATDGEASDAQAITSATATITANTKVAKALVTAATIADSATVVTVAVYGQDGLITSQAFTCEDTNPDADIGEFASGADDDAACENMATVINALLGDYVVATAGTGIVTLTVAEPGLYSLTVTSADATAVISTLEANGFVEIDSAQLSEGFTHVALKLTTTATIICGGVVVREGLASGGVALKPVVAGYTVL